MKCWNCNTEMKRISEMKGLEASEPAIILHDDMDDEMFLGNYNTLKNSIEHESEYTTIFGKKKTITEKETYYLNPIYNICPKCGLIAQFVDEKDMKKIFPDKNK